jgi:hypothetical protein
MSHFWQVSNKVQQAFVISSSRNDIALFVYPLASCLGNCAIGIQADCDCLRKLWLGQAGEFIALGFDGPEMGSAWDTKVICYAVSRSKLLL